MGLVGAAMLVPAPNHNIDLGLGLVLPLYAHCGFASIIYDYLPARRAPRLYPVLMGALYAGTGACALGLFAFNTRDVGITEAVARIWTATRSEPADD